MTIVYSNTLSAIPYWELGISIKSKSKNVLFTFLFKNHISGKPISLIRMLKTISLSATITIVKPILQKARKCIKQVFYQAVYQR